MENTSTNDTKRSRSGSGTRVQYIAQIGMLAAVATVLMLFEFPLPFVPNFYKLDFSEIPVLLGTFALGPVAGIMTECIKILLNFVINGTETGGIGEIANFLIGCSMCIPAGLIYQKIHNKKGAWIGLITGTLLMTVFGCLINAFVLLPTYAVVYGMPLDGLVQMGHALNPAINGVATFVVLAVAPFNLIKGVLISAILLLIYKKVQPILRK
nr:ECF transporter S component [uncultured Sellimonas sp.]